jgi:hypothetical protein
MLPYSEKLLLPLIGNKYQTSIKEIQDHFRSGLFSRPNIRLIHIAKVTLHVCIFSIKIFRLQH